MWPHVLAAARSQFTERNPHGVYAFGIGPHIRRGRARRQVTLNVYVKRKLDEPRAPVPELSVQVGKRTFTVKPNVVATGKRPRAAMAAPGAFTGLHPGAAISTQGALAGRGAVACLLSAGSGPSHALTAGHLFAPGAQGAAVFAARSTTSPVVQVGAVIANFLDTDNVDAAVVRLNRAGIAMVTDGGPSLADFLAESSIFAKAATAFLASTNDFSRETTTSVGPMDALLTAPTRGTFWVRGAVGTDGEVTNLGDSGTILCSGASNQFAVGTCSGIFGAHSVFEPFERVLTLVQQNIDSNLSL
jgi:hypothetical protein